MILNIRVEIPEQTVNGVRSSLILLFVLLLVGTLLFKSNDIVNIMLNFQMYSQTCLKGSPKESPKVAA